MRRILIACLLILTCHSADAGLFRRSRPAPQPCRGGTCPVQAAPRVAAYASPQGGDFLSRLNQFRALHRVGPAVWDANLAAAAATTTYKHSPGSSGGGWSCFMPLSSIEASLPYWEASPVHASYLLKGTRVGAAVGPGGSTVNML